MNRFQKIGMVLLVLYIGYCLYHFYGPKLLHKADEPKAYPTNMTADEWISDCADKCNQWAIDDHKVNLGIDAWHPFCNCVLTVWEVNNGKKDLYECSKICRVIYSEPWDKINAADKKRGKRNEG